MNDLEEEENGKLKILKEDKLVPTYNGYISWNKFAELYNKNLFIRDLLEGEEIDES